MIKYYYAMDSLNNILGLVDDNGALVVKYHLDAYVNHIRVTGNITQQDTSAASHCFWDILTTSLFNAFVS